MLIRGLETRPTIEEFMQSKDCPFSLTLDDWVILRTIHTFLEPFYDVTKSYEGDKVTLDAVLLYMDFLKDHLTKSSANYVNNTALIAAITIA